MGYFKQYAIPLASRRGVDWSPRSRTAFRYAAALGSVIAVTLLNHFTAMPNPLAGVIAMAVVLAGAWFGGLGPALAIPLLLWLISRLPGDQPERWWTMTPQELLAMTIITLLSAAFGLAGQYRRRIRTISRQHGQKLRDQARALSRAPIVFRDIDGRVTQWSEGAERLFGWKEEEAVGKLKKELLQTRFPSELSEIESALMRTGEWQGELIHQHREGNQLHVATQWILYRDQRGKPIGVAEIHSDVTDLRQTQAALRESDRRKEEFLAMLAHELRNPLAPIRTGLELMKMLQSEPVELEETRQIMERQVEQLVALVDDLLDISRISRGKLELRPRQVALAEIVGSAVETARPIVEAEGHRLIVSLPDQPIYLHADPHRLAQVLSNLLDNAAKYTPAGGGIWLKAWLGGDEVAISIRDNGVGIASEMLDQIFEMFTRSEGNFERACSGLGIGLALVKSIVEMHGGRVEAHSDGVGQGAEVTIRLPLAVEAMRAVQRPAPSASRVKRNERRVLIVDDNLPAAKLLSIVVKNLGNEVRVAGDGQEAIEIADAFQPEVVLMDLGMPRLDGYGAARFIRQQPWGQNMLLVALSGWGQEAHRQRAKDAGFDHHLVKPADPADIVRLLDESKRPKFADDISAAD